MAGNAFTYSNLREARWAAWLLTIIGLLSVAAGVIILFKPGDSLKTLAVIAGIFLVLNGIVEIVGALSHAVENRALAAILGVVSLLVGIVLIRHPFATVAGIALLLGLWLVAAGAVRFITAFDEEDDRTWSIVVALIEIVAGVVICASPNIGLATLALFAGIAFIANGIGIAALGWAMHEVTEEPAARRRRGPSAA
jgi:uncharacterized membrane protein HdeD (DUF308 family)